MIFLAVRDLQMYLQRSPAAGQQGCHGGVVGNKAHIDDVDERRSGGGREVEAVLVGGEAVDDGGEDAAAAVSAAADEEHGVLGVGEGAALVLPLSAECSQLHQSG